MAASTGTLGWHCPGSGEHRAERSKGLVTWRVLSQSRPLRTKGQTIELVEKWVMGIRGKRGSSAKATGEAEHSVAGGPGWWARLVGKGAQVLLLAGAQR